MRLRAAQLWPLAIVAVLGVTVAANAVLWVAASDRNAAAVEPDYYRKAVAWDSTLAQERANAALGWKVEAELSALDRAGYARLALRLTDRDGLAVRDARLAVVAIHNAAALSPVAARLVEGADGAYRARLPLVRSGRWELRVEGARGADRFTTRLHLECERGR